MLCKSRLILISFNVIDTDVAFSKQNALRNLGLNGLYRQTGERRICSGIECESESLYVFAW